MAMSGVAEAMLKAMEGSKETMGVGMMASPNAAVVEYALMKDYDAKVGDRGASCGLIQKIVIPLNDHETITVRRTSVDMKKDGCTWRGEIEGTGEPVMLMWWKGGRFSGMFTYRGHMYTLKNMGGEVHAVVETDPGKMPPDHGAMPAQPQSADVKDDPLVARGEGAMMRPRDRSNLQDRQDAIGGVSLPTASVTPDNAAQTKIEPLPAAKRRAMAAKKITIDLMVLYTGKVAAKYIDIDVDLIALAVEQANELFANSGLGNIKLRLRSQPADRLRRIGRRALQPPLSHGRRSWGRSRKCAPCAMKSAPTSSHSSSMIRRVAVCRRGLGPTPTRPLSSCTIPVRP